MFRSALIIGLLAVLPVTANALPICKGGFRTSCVVDGDTLWLPNGNGRVKIRIENLNAPEISKPHCDLELWRGLAAQKALADLTERGKVTFVPTGKKTYDRVLARVFVDGVDVAGMMVRDGVALPWRKHPPYPDWCANDPR